jgi:hypothetical protein
MVLSPLIYQSYPGNSHRWTSSVSHNVFALLLPVHYKSLAQPHELWASAMPCFVASKDGGAERAVENVDNGP